MDFIIADNLYDEKEFKEYCHVFWSKCGLKKIKFRNTFFLYDFIEKNRNFLKKEIIELITQMGSINLNNKLLFEYLSNSEDLSYWYLTTFLEKDIYLKDKKLIDIIKLIAFKKYLWNQNKKIIVYGCPEYFKHFLESFKNLSNKNINNQIIKKSYFVNTFASNIILIKIFIKFNLLFIRALFLKIIILIFSRERNYQNKTYFFNYFLRVKKSDTFLSGYWGGLINKLQTKKISHSFVHSYVKTNSHRNIFLVAFKIIKYNNYQNFSSHFLLEEFVTLNEYWNIVNDIISNFKKIKSKLVFNNFKGNNILPIIAEFMVDDLYDNFLKSNSADIIFKNYLFKNLVDKCDKKSKFIYLSESKNWEKSLCFYSNKKGISTFAYPHASIRYWDIRYSLSFDKTDKLSWLYFPCTFLLTGNHQLRNIYAKGFTIKNKKIKLVEATRYFHLLNKKKYKLEKNLRRKNILIIGDASKSSTAKLISLINKVKIDYKKFNLIFRPHPIAFFDESVFSLPIILDNSNEIERYLNKADIIITSHLTSSSYDGFYKSLPVFIMNHNSGLNLSPLEKNQFIEFETSNQLSDLINFYFKDKSILNKIIFLKDKNSDFLLNKNYKNWITLLN